MVLYTPCVLMLQSLISQLMPRAGSGGLLGGLSPAHLPNQVLRAGQGWRMLVVQRATRQLSGVVADTEQIRETLRRGLEINSKPVLPPINPQRQNGLTHDRAP